MYNESDMCGRYTVFAHKQPHPSIENQPQGVMQSCLVYKM